MKLQQIKDAIHASSLSVKHGVYTARWGFFYTHGCTATAKAMRVTTALPQALVIDSGEVWKSFNGGAPVAAQSHWFVKFTLDGSSVV
jgi:hypothetical protein